MTLPFENDTSGVVKKLAKRSLAAEKRRNLFVCCTIAFAVTLMAALSFIAIAQKAKVEEDVRGQYQVMVLQSTQERIDNLIVQSEVERWGLSKTYPIARYQDSVLSVLYADDNWMTLGNKPEVNGQMPQRENEILVERAFLDYFHLPQEYGQVIMLDLGYGEQAYTVTGILQAENLSRMFEVIVSKAFVVEHSQEVPVFEFRMRYSGGNQMDASQLKNSILTFLTMWDISEEEIFFSSNYFNMEGFRSAAGGYAIPAALLILFACGIVIYNIFYISVKGKVKEYGRFKVIGATPKQIKQIVRYESRILSLLGIPAGLIIGGVIASVNLSDYWNWARNSMAAAIIFIVTELMIFLSTATSVHMAAKVSPIEAIRVSAYTMESKGEKVHRLPRRITPISLAGMNFERSRKKAIITLVSLGLSGILLLTAATLFHSIDFESMAARFMGDEGNYMITCQDAVDMEEMQEQARNNPLSDELYEQILTLPEVNSITSYSAVTVEIALPQKADSFIITAMTREQFKQQLMETQMVEGTADYDALVESNGILISDSSNHIFDRYDYAPQIGDLIHLKTYGGQNMDVSVMGIVKEGSRGATGVMGSVLILPEEILHKLYPGIENFQIVWNIHAEQDSEALRKHLFEIAKDPAMTIIARSDLITSLQATMSHAVMLTYFFMAFLFIFALVNLSNTLMTNLLNRRQELGILQSVGMTRRQLSRMLSSECGRYIVGTLGLTAIIGGGCGAVLVQILNHLKVIGTLNYTFPFLELLVFAFALFIIQFLHVFAAIRYTKQQSIVDSIKALN